MRALFIYVDVPESETAPVMAPPIGVNLLHQMTTSLGHESSVVDLRLVGEDGVRSKVASFRPDLVGFSFLSNGWEQARTLASSLRALAPNSLFVAGGMHARIVMDGSEPEFDVVVKGDGETALPELLGALETGTRLPSVIVGSAADLDALPVARPYRDAYGALYSADRQFRSAYLQLGRGCSKHCTYCEAAVGAGLGNTGAYRTKSVDTLRREITMMREEYDINYLVFVDSIATLNTELFCAVIDFLNRELPDLSFQFNMFPNMIHVNDKLFETLAASTAWSTAWFGLESGSQRMIDFYRKGFKLERAERVIRATKETGVKVALNLLLGAPGESERDYELTRQFVAEMDPAFANPNIFHPLPGTELYDHCMRQLLIRRPGDYTVRDAHHLALHPEDGPLRTVDYGLVVEGFFFFDEQEHDAVTPRWPKWR